MKRASTIPASADPGEVLPDFGLNEARSLAAFRPEQLARLELLRIVMLPQLMRDAGVAIAFAKQLEAFVIHGAPPTEAGGQA